MTGGHGLWGSLHPGTIIGSPLAFDFSQCSLSWDYPHRYVPVTKVNMLYRKILTGLDVPVSLNDFYAIATLTIVPS